MLTTTYICTVYSVHVHVVKLLAEAAYFTQQNVVKNILIVYTHVIIVHVHVYCTCASERDKMENKRKVMYCTLT